MEAGPYEPSAVGNKKLATGKTQPDLNSLHNFEEVLFYLFGRIMA